MGERKFDAAPKKKYLKAWNFKKQRNKQKIS